VHDDIAKLLINDHAAQPAGGKTGGKAGGNVRDSAAHWDQPHAQAGERDDGHVD
jgi:hypothetical protein